MKTKEAAKLTVPLLFIPITLYTALLLGNTAATILIASLFLFGIIKSKGQERRFMVIMAVVAAMFETANIASGAYRFPGTLAAPRWVALGWGVLGIYLVKNMAALRRIKENIVYAILLVAYAGVWTSRGMTSEELVLLVFALLSVYVLSITFKMPVAFFGLASLMGLSIEFLGTTLGVWTYFDIAGAPIAPPLLSLAASYAVVIGFSMWLSRAKA